MLDSVLADTNTITSGRESISLEQIIISEKTILVEINEFVPMIEA